MDTTIIVCSEKKLCIDDYFVYMDVPELKLDSICEFSGCMYWYFYRENISTTLFALEYDMKNTYRVSIDNLAAYDDLKFFPYLVDSLVAYLSGKMECDIAAKSLYSVFDEEWVEKTVSEEIAMLKSVLSIKPKYFLTLPKVNGCYVSLDILYDFGVNLHSSTPRIYGYMQYMMQHGLLPFDDAFEMSSDDALQEEEIEVEIPRHVAVGCVKSWQTDGSETYETYSREDVVHLLDLADRFRRGKMLEGVVLNDIGTIYQEGIGVPVNGEEAVYWFTEACNAGDTLYAPSNLGDLYRKGCGSVLPSLPEAFKAYSISVDPYSHYRIGQAYEEGWLGVVDMDKAMKWYKTAAAEGHHLAVERLRNK